MFFPTALDISRKAFDGESAAMRDYFCLEVDETTIWYNAKLGCIAPENPYGPAGRNGTTNDSPRLTSIKGGKSTTATAASILEPSSRAFWPRI